LNAKSETAEPAAICQACEIPLQGRYCHACGDDSLPPARDWRDLIEDWGDSVFSFTAAVPRTLQALITRPSLVPRALRAGDRRSFLPPVKLYFSITVVFFLFVALSHVEIVQLDIVPDDNQSPRVVVENGIVRGIEHAHVGAKWLRVHEPHARNAEAVAAFEDAKKRVPDPFDRALLNAAESVADHPGSLNDDIETWAPRALWVMLPIYAGVLWLLYRKGRLLSEHLIFSLWAHAMMFLLFIAGAVWNWIGLAGGLAIALAAYQVYLTLALRDYYEDSLQGAIVKGALHTGAYVGLIWLPAGFLFVLFSQAHDFFYDGHWTKGLGL
jgi:hypothetical protein